MAHRERTAVVLTSTGAVMRTTHWIVFIAGLGLCSATSPVSLAAGVPTRHRASDITGTVTDSVSGQPIASADIVVTQNGSTIVTTNSDAFGRFTIHNLSAGSYSVMARSIGFRPSTRAVTVSDPAADLG